MKMWKSNQPAFLRFLLFTGLAVPFYGMAMKVAFPPDVSVQASENWVPGQLFGGRIELFNRVPETTTVSHIEMFVVPREAAAEPIFPILPVDPTFFVSFAPTNILPWKKWNVPLAQDFTHIVNPNAWKTDEPKFKHTWPERFYFPATGSYWLVARDGISTSKPIRIQIDAPTGELAEAWAALPKTAYRDLFRKHDTADYRLIWETITRSNSLPDSWNALLAFQREHPHAMYSVCILDGLKDRVQNMEALLNLQASNWPATLMKNRLMIWPPPPHPPEPWVPFYETDAGKERMKKREEFENARIDKYFGFLVFPLPVASNWEGQLEYKIARTPTNVLAAMEREYGRKGMIRPFELNGMRPLNKDRFHDMSATLKARNYPGPIDETRYSYAVAFLLKDQPYTITFTPNGTNFLPVTTNVIVHAGTNVIEFPLVRRP